MAPSSIQMMVSCLSETESLDRREELRLKQVLVNSNPGSNMEANWEADGCFQLVTGTQYCAPGNLVSVLSR